MAEQERDPEPAPAPASAEAGQVGGQERAQLLRAYTAPVLIPVRTFWHRACVARACQIIGLFVGLSVGGTIVYTLVSPILGAAALAMGPSFIIIWIFYKRFQCSTAKLQACYTFSEAILWMLVLFIVIEFVDKWNKDFTSEPVVLECDMEAEEGGKVFVNALSFAANCFRTGGEFSDPEPLKDWDGLNCSELPAELLGGSDYPPRVRTGENGTLPLPALYVIAIAKFAANQTNGTVCSAVEDFVPDAVGDVIIPSMAFAGVSSQTESQAGLQGAFDELFGRSAEGQGDCPCTKDFREDAVPAYDFCSEDGFCNVSAQASCAARSREAQCALAQEDGPVTAELSFQKRTVLYAFIEAYFRAAFLEELLKYWAVRRILFKDRVVDCGGLIVYGLAAAAGFATAENIQYTMIHGVFVTYARMILSIPMHCCTGMMIGIHLGYRKFLGEGKTCLDKFFFALAMPVFVHGTYDFILMLPKSEYLPHAVRPLLGMSVMVLGFVICRCMWLRIDNVCIVHVKDLQNAGRVSKSACCCWERDCCRSWFVQEDPVLQEKSPSRVSPIGLSRAGAASSQAQAEIEDNDNFLMRLSRSFSSELLPEAPACQTAEDTCPDCRNTVRVHVLYPSDCPYCGHSFPDPAPPQPQQP